MWWRATKKKKKKVWEYDNCLARHPQIPWNPPLRWAADVVGWLLNVKVYLTSALTLVCVATVRQKWQVKLCCLTRTAKKQRMWEYDHCLASHPQTLWNPPAQWAVDVVGWLLNVSVRCWLVAKCLSKIMLVAYCLSNMLVGCLMSP